MSNAMRWLLVVWIILPVRPGMGGHGVGNGGDGDAFDFPIIGALIHRRFEVLQQEGRLPLKPHQLTAFRAAVDDTRVVMVHQSLQDRFGAPVDAVTDPDPARPGKFVTTVNGDRFRKRMEQGTVFRLVCHEYFRAAGIPDDQGFTLKTVYPFLDDMNAHYLADLQRLNQLGAAVRDSQGSPAPGIEGQALKRALSADLRRALDASDPGANRQAFEQAFEVADRTGMQLREVHGVVDSLRSPVARERMSAAYELGRLQSSNPLTKVSIPFLIQLLNDPDLSTQLATSSTLGKMAPEAVQPLIRALEHPDAKVNERAADALGDMGAAANAACGSLRVLYLKFFRQAEWPRIAAAVQENLKKIGTHEALQVLNVLPLDKQGAETAHLARIREQVYREEAARRGVTVEEIRRRMDEYHVRRSGVIGLKQRDPGPRVHRPAVSPSLKGFDWDEDMGTLVWEDPIHKRDPEDFFREQTYTYYLLSHGGTQPPPIHFPSFVQDPPGGIRDRLRRQSPGTRQTTTDTLYEWDAKNEFRWTDPNEFIDPLLHYQRQLYVRYVLAGMGVAGGVSTVPPPHVASR